MVNSFGSFSKLIVTLIFICIYYVIALFFSAYLLSMSEKNVLEGVMNDWKAANQSITASLISETTKQKIGSAIAVDIIKYVRVILGDAKYAIPFFLFSTAILIAIGILIYSKIVLNLDEVKNKEDRNLSNLNWMDKSDITALKQKNVISEKNGIILGRYKNKKVSKLLTLASTGKTNKHIMLLGNSGSGKSRAYVKTNIINLSREWHSFIISDPKGEYLNDTSEFLSEKGYDIKVLNLVNIKHSHRWNPMDYVHDVIDAQYLTDIIIEKMHRDSKAESDKNIIKIERELLKNLIIYVKEKFNKNVQNFNAIYSIISTFKPSEIDELLMHESNIIYLSEYAFYLKQTYKEKEIAINHLIDELNVFDMKAVSNMLKTTEIKLEAPKIRPCAYFIILPDMHGELDLIGSMFVAMLTKRITEIHDDMKDEVIKNREVFLMLDEFANFGFIPKFANRLSQFRARRINCSIIVNSIMEIKKYYTEEESMALINSCDTKLFFGCNDDATSEFFKNVIAKNLNAGDTKILDTYDLVNLDIDTCIAIIRGQKPVNLYKYDWMGLREYKLISGKSKHPLAKWLRDQIDFKVKEKKFNTEDVDIQIKEYDYKENVRQEIDKILYYNDYKNNSKIKVFENNEEDDEYDDREEKAE